MIIAKQSVGNLVLKLYHGESEWICGVSNTPINDSVFFEITTSDSGLFIDKEYIQSSPPRSEFYTIDGNMPVGEDEYCPVCDEQLQVRDRVLHINYDTITCEVHDYCWQNCMEVGRNLLTENQTELVAEEL